ncbi:glycosyl transferase [Clostridium carboxidivorans P7]|uniref:Glycosyltransferase n=1 Tax=Clostridium carboxidivorans P7 TaxID=536227 RepID=C6PXY5_9CLOT|nr:glycoside hydrolase family 99-like domain-containing protein [Clostridium carboxidivorans]AKN31953.1 glycosyl transferase [Clostridium carboxidivorans P7]EET85923.1 glycosyltransferase [Clostridium carboxidivorans P7]EFG87916.1 hypothetical protein CLCAR_2519 [Clostridium carboxidivorans P7]
MRIIAFYLPQFHSIPENDQWWGTGFTEWVNVKKAKPLFDGHYQPRVPLNKNYYNLLDDSVKEWQIKLAKDYGVYGFCFYHYWFNGHMLLQRPVEQFLKNKDLDLPFCICWANEHWTQAWVSKNSRVLIEQKYGNEKEWKEHFNYLLPYFKDSRYIKNNGKPLFVIYRPEIIGCLNEMLDCWQDLAQKNGLPGIDFAYQHINFDISPKRDSSRFSFNIEYQPPYAYKDLTKNKFKHLKSIRRVFLYLLERYFKCDIRGMRPGGVIRVSYDAIWKEILKRKPQDEKCIPGAFVDWDNTSRKGEKGSIYEGATPEKFQKYLTAQIRRARDVYKKDMLFIFAWNEWAECGYLEPDEKFGYGYLEAIKQALLDNDEFSE